MTNTVLVALHLLCGPAFNGTNDTTTANERRETELVVGMRPAYVQVCTNKCDYCKAFASYQADLVRVGSLTVYIAPPEGQCSCRYEKMLDHYDLVPVRRAE